MKRAGFCAAALLTLMAAAPRAATIVIVNGDTPGEGLNDGTLVAPVGGNTGSTRGEQRMIALQAAADVWGARIFSAVTIKVLAQFNPIAGCTAGSGVVGTAGATAQVSFDDAVPAGAYPATFYPIALAEALSGNNLNGADNEVNAVFNSDVDGPVCFGSKGFWYGIDPGNVPPTALALFPVVLHELGHGLGFASLACLSPAGCADKPQGAFLNDDNDPDIWARFLAQMPAGMRWADMSDAQRATSMASEPNLVWSGTRVTATAGSLVDGTTQGLVRMHAPPTVEPGSSVSHFSTSLLPDENLEPFINLNSVVHDPGRALPLLRDLGWRTLDDLDRVFGNGFEN